jgi:hypothetical protein
VAPPLDGALGERVMSGAIPFGQEGVCYDDLLRVPIGEGHDASTASPMTPQRQSCLTRTALDPRRQIEARRADGANVTTVETMVNAGLLEKRVSPVGANPPTNPHPSQWYESSRVEGTAVYDPRASASAPPSSSS